MATFRPSSPEARLALQVRQQFVTEVDGAMVDLTAQVQGRLASLADEIATPAQMQERRDALIAFRKQRTAWVDAVRKGWREALLAPPAPRAARLPEAMSLELVGNEAVENKILSSRLVLALLDKVTWELNDLRLRMQRLEGTSDLATGDVLRPEVLAGLLVDKWADVGMPRNAWIAVQDVVQKALTDRLTQAYHRANEFLIQRGVVPDVSVKPRAQRPSPAAARPGAPAPNPGETSSGYNTGAGVPAGMDSAPGGAYVRGSGRAPAGAFRGASGAFGRAPGPAAGPVSGPGPASGAAPPSSRMGPSGGFTRAAEETRMLTTGTPLSRVRQRAQGVLGQLRRLLSDRVSDFDATRPSPPSPALAAAISEFESAEGADYADPHAVYDSAAVQQVAGRLRERANTLKDKAASTAEKATVEIVALMFQSILAEERIPATIRVWFARLQMPVLRVAIAEPEFFGTLEHPARQLIDRMGGCVMGFDVASIGGSALESEIKRVVQVIEQYPETGRRVFQLVYDEFQKFLSRFLTEAGGTQRVVSVAQQVEQKETLSIQYTIEMRNMLNTMQVRDEIREFLFKVWAEVLALAAVKNGPQHEDTLMLKRTATDLVWAASAKPNRTDRARVIQDLPNLLQRLRQGMTMLGVVGATQEAHIKIIGDTLADAFMSKTEAIPQAAIDAMSKRLANLEDFVGDEEMGDLPLNAESVEMMLGIDASNIEVITEGGSKPSAGMVAWSQAIDLGAWFAIDHNGKAAQVQYVWRSQRKQLHLFVTSDGHSYLMQASRLAAYLQAGLLVPTEEEALTVRATREALAKLDANPARLMA